jgi:hypothetical protein
MGPWELPIPRRRHRSRRPDSALRVWRSGASAIRSLLLIIEAPIEGRELRLKFATYFSNGADVTRPRRAPGSALRKIEADEGVGRGPGDRPTGPDCSRYFAAGFRRCPAGLNKCSRQWPKEIISFAAERVAAALRASAAVTPGLMRSEPAHRFWFRPWGRVPAAVGSSPGRWD